MTLGELAQLLQGELKGPPDLPVSGPVPSDSDNPHGVAFAESDAYLSVAERSGVGALILPRSLSTDLKPFIHVDDAREAFGRLLAAFDRPMHLNPGIHPTAVVDSSAEIDASAQIGPYAVVEHGVRIGARVRVYAHAYVGEECHLQEDSVIYPHAVLYRNVHLGARSIVHAGTVIGADGFGYGWDGKRRVKIPQVGAVVIENDCELGALSSVDRATIGHTRIGEGTKIDNFVHIGHNASLGSHCALAAQVGLSGSTRVGDRVVMGGQSGTSHHISICDDVLLGGRTAVVQDLENPGQYLGYPARPIGEAKRAMMLVAKLPELFARLRRLERAVKEDEA